MQHKTQGTDVVMYRNQSHTKPHYEVHILWI
jgi:hypothetical protein